LVFSGSELYYLKGRLDVRCKKKQRKVRTPKGRILPNGKLQKCRASSTEINRLFCFAERARVKWWCKRPPVSLVTEIARNALSGAMPNRKARMLPASLSGRQLKLFCEEQLRGMNITYGKPQEQNPAYKSSPLFKK